MILPLLSTLGHFEDDQGQECVRPPCVLIWAWRLHLTDWIRHLSDSCGMVCHSWTTTWQRSYTVYSGCGYCCSWCFSLSQTCSVCDRSGEWMSRARCQCFWPEVHSAWLAARGWHCLMWHSAWSMVPHKQLDVTAPSKITKPLWWLALMPPQTIILLPLSSIQEWPNIPLESHVGLVRCRC